MTHVVKCLLLSIIVLSLVACGDSGSDNQETVNSAPIAIAGVDQSVEAGTLVTLDGSSSSDEDGDTLTYQWSFVSVPSDSSASLTNATSVSATFTTDVAGSYQVQLVVSDGEDTSSADTVTITASTTSVENTAPEADAGTDQTVETGTLVTLNGASSSDDDDDTLTYQWSFVSIPSGSEATLSNATSVSATFTADSDGDYEVQLIVNDGAESSSADTVTITASSTAATNTAPIAEAGDSQSVETGAEVTLDGSSSSDEDGDTLTYQWSLLSTPTDSEAELTNATTVSPSFTTDLDGVYTIQLIVNDGSQNSTADTVAITATTSTSSADTITILDYNPSGAAEGDTDNTGEDEDDLVENASFDGTVIISYADTSVSVTNPFEDNGVEISVDGADVTVVATISGVAYDVAGSSTEGSLKIYSDNKFQLGLSDLELVNSDGPAINIQSKKTVFVILEGESSLIDGTTYSDIPDDEDAKATFFSEGQLIFSGSGELTVTANYKHGIVSDDYIRVRDGNIIVTDAVKDAIHTNDYFIADGGSFTLAAQSDGIDASEGYIIINDGVFNIDVLDDGIAASYDISEEDEPDESITPNVTINGGTFTITTSEGEGIEAKSEITINDGQFEINAYDDAINAGDMIYINGGQIYAYSSSNDSVDSNGEITITGGVLIAIGSSAPEAGIDADSNTIKFTGGTILGLGGTTSLPSSTESTQNSIVLDGVAKDSILHIHSESQDEALTFLVPKQVATILYSSAKLSLSESYDIYVGGSVSDGESFNGLYTSGELSLDGASLSESFTLTDVVTQLGGQTGPGGGGGRGGPGGQ